MSERSERINVTVRFAERSEATVMPAPPKAVAPMSERSERINVTVRFAERSEATVMPAPPKAVAA